MSSWNWLRDGVGGGVDFLTGGVTDFDGKGNSINWGQTGSPWGGGSDGKWGAEDSWVDKGTDFLNAFKGPAGSPTAGGSSFLSSQTKPAATAVTGASGSTGTLGDDVAIFNPAPFVALRDNPEPANYGSGSSGKSSSGNKLLGAASTALGVAKLFGLCDIRTKTNISPLEMTEVNDDLAQVAFFVKELRECS
jgi:hypothetical protein